MTDFKPGEIVDITIKGARVEESTDDQGNLEFTYSGDSGLVSFEGVVVSLADAVTIARVAPAEWPPRPGDLWRDSYPRGGRRPIPNDVWLVRGPSSDDAKFLNEEGGADRLLMTSSGGDTMRPEMVERLYGPLTLVHREEASS